MFKTAQTFFITLAISFILISCGPSNQEAKNLGFSDVAEMKNIQSKGFKTKEEYAKSLGFDTVLEMSELMSKGFKTKEEYAKSLGFDSIDEMNRLVSKGFPNKQAFIDLQAEEAKDPLKICSRKMDPDYSYPIDKNWKLIRCNSNGRIFITKIQEKGSNSVYVTRLSDVPTPVLYYLKDNSKAYWLSVESTDEYDCRLKRKRSSDVDKFYSGKMATGTLLDIYPMNDTWFSFNHPMTIAEIIPYACGGVDKR